ncbi:hypothetical protein BP6252_12671 [Coleophoma cylindrospora]|uniref:Fe2OG dioxygenase domain-containing protein n=1 Tax=Coleophoma cylindrospora TaxID=1849047 RepID=A0A3D8QDS6_9HELO|nr:hypothetical protein BP6252_12671 [Coleophoma cylindrospora]
MIGYFLALIPLYIVLYQPITNLIYGTPALQIQINPEIFLNTSFIAVEDATSRALDCPAHTYQTHILKLEPLIIYIEDFLTVSEQEHLIKISADKFEPSTVTTGQETSVNEEIRRSEVAFLDRDNVVRCIENRARAFQGWRENLHIERLRTQRYGPGGHYAHHYDWSGGSRAQDRVSTFMVYVDVSEDIQGGGTEFPRLRMKVGEESGMGRWCEFLDCEKMAEASGEGEGEGGGLVFRPVKRNAVFWVNIQPDGRGYEETWHAGLPVEKGEKVGLNIWSWGSARGA